MQTSVSWRNAFFLSGIIHLVVISGVILFLSWKVAQPVEQYVIDMDLSQGTMQGGGHAGGSSGGGTEGLFPKPLSEETVSQRLEQVKEMSSVLTPNSSSVTPPITDANNKDNASATNTSNVQNQNSKGEVGGTATGSGDGTSSGNGSGTGSGTGVGNANGDGIGQGDGKGNGQGSGDANVSGTGSQPFDVDGFWAAVDAQKQYPAAAVKRRLTGSVTIVTTIGADGSCLGVDVASSSGHSILDEAAKSAARAACPYNNPTGETVTVTTNVSFDLQ